MSTYPRKSVGHVLDYLRADGIPEHIAGTVTVGNEVIKMHTQHFANYKYFEGIEQPLFRYQEQVYSQHRHVIENDNTLRSNFRLSLSNHNTPGIVVYGWDATQSLREFLRSMLTNWIEDPCYDLHKAAGAFFQGGYVDQEDNEHGFIYIEFWLPAGAQAFVDHLNKNFTRPLKE